jgi:type II secretory pathway predicted ATPase ExeA
MFLEHYNLREQPFGVTPDPRFLYLNHMYRESLASLWYGIQERRGFMALIAHPGMGKTTLLFQLLQHLRRTSAKTVFLFQTCCSSNELIRYLLLDLGISPSTDSVSMHNQLNEALLQVARTGKQFVFVIDEAQNLTQSTLESVRLLSDFETPQGKLMQIILAGQPQLVKTLMKPEMLQLTQRLAVTTFLDPLDGAEVEKYIRHRIRLAGYQGEPLFTSDALRLVAQESHGIPRNINNICFGALSLAFALRKRRVDRRIVEEVAGEQNVRSLGERVVSFQPQKPRVGPGYLVPDSTVGLTERPSSQRAPIPSWVGRYVQRAACVLVFLFVLMPSVARPEKGAPSSTINRSMASVITPALEIAASAQESTSAKTESGTRVALRGRFSDHRVVVVERRQTLRKICRRYLGHYNVRIERQIRALNRELDPNRLIIGQQIRLPGRQASRFVRDHESQQIAALGK